MSDLMYLVGIAAMLGNPLGLALLAVGIVAALVAAVLSVGVPLAVVEKRRERREGRGR